MTKCTPAHESWLQPKVAKEKTDRKDPKITLGCNKKVHCQVKVCGDQEPNPVGPTGGSWDQIRLSRAAKMGPFGGLWSAVEV